MICKPFWKKPEFLGNIAYLLLCGLRSTLQMKINADPKIDPNRAYLFAFWHGKQLLPSLFLHAQINTRRCAMVSPSYDGTILATYLQRMGFETIRASSRKNNIAGLMQLKRNIEQNVSVGFGVDGPTGPIHNAKPGMIYLAQKCNVPIIPVGTAIKRFWTFNKAWDKFQLPKPFTTAALVLGEPFMVNTDMDSEIACKVLDEHIHKADRDAYALITQ